MRRKKIPPKPCLECLQEGKALGRSVRQLASEFGRPRASIARWLKESSSGHTCSSGNEPTVGQPGTPAPPVPSGLAEAANIVRQVQQRDGELPLPPKPQTTAEADALRLQPEARAAIKAKALARAARLIDSENDATALKAVAEVRAFLGGYVDVEQVVTEDSDAGQAFDEFAEKVNADRDSAGAGD